MRHRKAGSKLGRTSSHRDAMFRNMVTSLLKYQKIRTTDVKAKVLRGWVDHLITLAKKGDLHSRRQALSIVREKAIVHQLFEKVESQFGDRNGGYTRIVKIGRRAGDSAPMSLIELIVAEEKKKKTKTKKKKAEAKPTVDKKESTSDEKESTAKVETETAASDVEAKGEAEAETPEADTVAENAEEITDEEVSTDEEAKEETKDDK